MLLVSLDLRRLLVVLRRLRVQSGHWSCEPFLSAKCPLGQCAVGFVRWTTLTNCYRYIGRRGGPVAQLTVVVGPPAVDVAGRQQGAEAIDGSDDCRGRGDVAHWHRHIGKCAGPVAELTVVVEPPAAHVTCREHGAEAFAVAIAGDCLGIADTSNGYRHIRVCRGSPAELTVGAGPPALHLASREHGAVAPAVAIA